MLSHIAPTQRGETWHLLMPCGRDLTAGEAIITLLEALRATRLLGGALRLTRAATALDLIDRLMKRVRGRLGRFVPNVVAPRAFP